MVEMKHSLIEETLLTHCRYAKTQGTQNLACAKMDNFCSGTEMKSYKEGSQNQVQKLRPNHGATPPPSSPSGEIPPDPKSGVIPVDVTAGMH